MRDKYGAKFRECVEKKEERRIGARALKGTGMLAWFGVFGIVGWSVAVPLLLGIALGKWLDGIIHKQYSFTLMLMFAGLAVGCLNAWFWVKKSLRGGTGPKSQVPGPTEDGKENEVKSETKEKKEDEK